MSSSSESLPRFNRLKRRHELNLRQAGLSACLFQHDGVLGMLTIYPDVAFVSGPKTTSRVELERLAGVVYQRSVAQPWFGFYRLTFVYLGESGGKKETASVVMGYGEV
jgi:hypothetical protein